MRVHVRDHESFRRNWSLPVHPRRDLPGRTVQRAGLKADGTCTTARYLDLLFRNGIGKVFGHLPATRFPFQKPIALREEHSSICL
jgi:hypothetical protein